MADEPRKHPNFFIDLFAGCGGLALGLAQAGWKGLFAVEKDPIAFRTLRRNLVDDTAPNDLQFSWPNWLPQEAMSIETILKEYSYHLEELKGKVPLIAGGPPCQGFSFAGRRRREDPRNNLFRRYLEFVAIVEPAYVLVENVPGMAVAHGKRSAKFAKKPTPFAERLIAGLEDCGYAASIDEFDAQQFGVPQKRNRLFILATRGASFPTGLSPIDAMKQITAGACQFAKSKGLRAPVSACAALSDLETKDRPLRLCMDLPKHRKHKELIYAGPQGPYQALMHAGFKHEAMNSMRLANHSDTVRRRFLAVQNLERGKNISVANRKVLAEKALQTKKQRIHPMHPDRPAPTVVTLPDDLVHYSEPRILTVRECARLQSFPDWFAFEGKYTTGGHRRKKECPRYTQVGNAVPPLLAEAIGGKLLELHNSSVVIDPTEGTIRRKVAT